MRTSPAANQGGDDRAPGQRRPTDEFDADAAVEELFRVVPEDFVGRRAELVTAARAARDAEAVRRLQDLRKPTLAAWAGNVFVQVHGSEAGQFIQLGQSLREAVRTLDREGMRELTAQQWRLISALARQISQVAGEHGHRLSDTIRQEIETTLRAVAADEDASAQWSSGRLSRSLVPPSSITAAAVHHADRAPAAPKKEPPADQRHKRHAAEQAASSSPPGRRRQPHSASSMPAAPTGTPPRSRSRSPRPTRSRRNSGCPKPRRPFRRPAPVSMRPARPGTVRRKLTGRPSGNTLQPRGRRPRPPEQSRSCGHLRRSSWHRVSPVRPDMDVAGRG